MGKNLVLIKTAFAYGSGILYTCEYPKKLNSKNTFIICTNGHVLERVDENDDMNLQIDLLLTDKSGFEIPKLDKSTKTSRNEGGYEILHLFRTLYLNAECDIAALLISMTDKYELDADAYISFAEPSEGEALYTEGFPLILANDRISNSIMLKGENLILQPLNKDTGRYRILSDYHIYGDTYDLEILAGLSGAPVYCDQFDRTFIVGMNNSISMPIAEKNPYKIVNFLKIEQVLCHLRELGCILFESNNNIPSIIWIYETKDAEVDEFVKTADLKSEKKILVVGGSGAGKSSFIRSLALHGDLIDSSGDGQTTRLRTDYVLSLYEAQPSIEVTLLREIDFINKRFEMAQLKLIELGLETYCDVKVKDLSENLFLYLHDVAKQTKINIPESLTSQPMHLLYSNNDEKNENTAINYYKQALKDNDPQKMQPERIRQILLEQEGFFYLQELSFLDENCDEPDSFAEKLMSRAIRKIYGNEEIRNLAELLINEWKGATPDISVFYKNIYTELYQLVRDYLLLNDIELPYTNKMCFSLLEIANQERAKELVQYSLKVECETSLTGMIDKVVIRDSLSNNYAYMFYKLGLQRVTLVDTYGLDHIEQGNRGTLRVLQEIFTPHMKKDEILDAVLYIKKLDSGRPTELGRLIPKVIQAEPNAPVYCMFTGIDMYRNTDSNDTLVWNNEFNCSSPKGVQYLLSKEGRANILKDAPGSEAYKAMRYDVLSRNIIAYSSVQVGRNCLFMKSNRINLYKLFLSILMEEMQCTPIYHEEKIDVFIDSTLFGGIVEDLMRKLFRQASVIDWEKRHHMTIKANARRIFLGSGGKDAIDEMGYWGTYRDRWDVRFRDAYKHIFTQDLCNELKGLGNEKSGNLETEIIEQAALRIREDFFGEIEDLARNRSSSEARKGEFRSILEQMYDIKNGDDPVYLYNPFTKLALKEESSVIRKLNNVTNFSLGIENECICKKFCVHYIKTLKHEIETRNKRNFVRRFVLSLEASDALETLYQQFKDTNKAPLMRKSSLNMEQKLKFVRDLFVRYTE